MSNEARGKRENGQEASKRHAEHKYHYWYFRLFFSESPFRKANGSKTKQSEAFLFKKNISSSDLEEQVYKQAYTIGVINESGLYAAIFGSKLEFAKKLAIYCRCLGYSFREKLRFSQVMKTIPPILHHLLLHPARPVLFSVKKGSNIEPETAP